MGLHVHDILEFDFAHLGEAGCYFYVFFPNNFLEDFPSGRSYEREWFLTFSEMIGNEGVVVSDIRTDISWMFYKDLPPYISQHAFMYSLIVVAFVDRQAAQGFHNELRRVLDRSQRVEVYGSFAYAGSDCPTNFLTYPDSVIVAIPPPRFPYDPVYAKQALTTIALAVRSGAVQKAIREDTIEDLAHDFSAAAGSKVLCYRRAIILDRDGDCEWFQRFVSNTIYSSYDIGTIESVIRERFEEIDRSLAVARASVLSKPISVEERVQFIADELTGRSSMPREEMLAYRGLLAGCLVAEIRGVRESLRDKRQSREVQALRRELKALRKAVSARQEGRAVAKVELATGFQVFGSGIKGSLELSMDVTDKLDNLQEVLEKWVSVDKLVERAK